MYLRRTLHVITEATKTLFDAEYPVDIFKNLYVSIEYPIERANYPGIWIDFETQGNVSTVGIGHREDVAVTDPSPPHEVTGYQEFHRWRFSGFASFTVVAMTSNERAMLYDELLRVVAFGGELAATKQFRDAIENNTFIGINGNWDEVAVSAPNALPGTPWGTEEIIYEATIRVSMVGEFVSGGTEGLILPIGSVEFLPYTGQPGDGALDDSDGPWLGGPPP